MMTKLIYAVAALAILSLALYFGLLAMSPNTPQVHSEAVQTTPDVALIPEATTSSTKIDAGFEPRKKTRPRMTDQIGQATNNQLGSQPSSQNGNDASALKSLQIEKSLEASQRQVAFGSIRNELNHVMRNGMNQIDIGELDQVLKKLQALSESDGSVSGVDISPLRNNLAVVAKINQVNDKIKLEAEKTVNQDFSKLNDYVAELQALQKQIQPVTVNTNLAAGSGQP